MTPADALRNWLTAQGLSTGYRVQFGRWTDGQPSDQFVVIQLQGGLPAEVIRQSQLRLVLIGAVNGDSQALATQADNIIQAMRSYSGDVVNLQPSEPAFFNTEEGRPLIEIAVDAITV